jgi:hypothetical protein
LHHYYGDGACLTVTRDEHGATVAELRLPAADVDRHINVPARRATP